jgi:hypothetical protein
MPALDCHDLDTALASLGGLLSTDPHQLEAALRGFAFCEFEAAMWRSPYPAREVVWDRIVGQEIAPPTPPLVYWFHATRVPPGTDFREGLQPLPERLPRIKQLLSTLADQLDPAKTPLGPWKHPGWHYTLKISSPSEWGPDASLVRDAIIHCTSPTRDYLAAGPEIVEDIAAMVAGDRALLLVEAFRNATRPCIVKFRSTKPREDVVQVALFYAYSTLWGQEQCIETNTCFAGEGRTIPVEDIVQVEYLT